MGSKNVACIENVHIYACKRFLNVYTMSCNDAILGDLGRYPMYIFAAKRCLKYWLRLLNMSGHRYVKLCYDMLAHSDNLGYNNWVSDVRVHLYQNGFGYIWETWEDFKFYLNMYKY